MSRGIVVMVIALIPLSVQFGIMKTRHDTWAFSKVGQQTANRYAFALLYGSTNHLSLTQARQAVKEYDIADMLSYTIQHPSSAFRVWVTLVRKNLTAGSAVTDIPRPRPVSTSFMKQTNKVYAYIHLAMTIPLAICMFLAWRQKKTALKQTLAILLFPICLVFTTSGLTFWQADRIVAPVVPLWIVLYTITLRALYSGVKGASSKRHSLCLNSIYRQN